jgi:hypothetical protein
MAIVKQIGMAVAASATNPKPSNQDNDGRGNAAKEK